MFFCIRLHSVFDSVLERIWGFEWQLLPPRRLTMVYGVEAIATGTTPGRTTRESKTLETFMLFRGLFDSHAVFAMNPRHPGNLFSTWQRLPAQPRNPPSTATTQAAAL